KTWWRCFKNQNKSSLKFKKVQALDPSGARNFNRKGVAQHFERWREAYQDYDIPPENMWNMDEKAIQLGGGCQGSNWKFFFDAAQGQLYKVKSNDLKMVTIIECISAAGVAMELTFISPSGDLGDWWEVEGVGVIGVSENGWTDNRHGENWFEKHFVPQATALNKLGKPIILLLDGHQSHVSDEMKNIAFKNNILLICMPPKTTHKLQLLDRLVFAAVQAAWAKLCEERAIIADVITLQTVIRDYMEAWQEGMKETTIKHSWQVTGHWPFNPNIFTDDDYAPSLAYAVDQVVPDSY
ncbi:hypothetical protein M407DRAFT_63378, partial [Tulasnella calospora MUT 4182]